MKILILPNYSKPSTPEVIRKIQEEAKYFGITTMIMDRKEAEDTYFHPGECSILSYSREVRDFLQTGHHPCIMAVGGDGTIIHGARLSAASNAPIVGVNAGHLGFLAQMTGDNLRPYFTALAESDYRVETRSALAASVDGVTPPGFDFAMNDIIVSKAPEYSVAQFQLYCNEKLIDHYRADGIIFSTATGSTAYSLSAGGAVIDPQLQVTEVVPICAHSIATRPMIFSPDGSLTVHGGETPLVLNADGHAKTSIAAGSAISIRASKMKAKMIVFQNYEFFEVLAAKMKQRG